MFPGHLLHTRVVGAVIERVSGWYIHRRPAVQLVTVNLRARLCHHLSEDGDQHQEQQ